MPNAIKYNVSAETLALKKGNFWIGTGDVSKGPTSNTGYYNGITPPSGGYTIYLNKANNGPSIYTVTNDAQLINTGVNFIVDYARGDVSSFDGFGYFESDTSMFSSQTPITVSFWARTSNSWAMDVVGQSCGNDCGDDIRIQLNGAQCGYNALSFKSPAFFASAHANTSDSTWHNYAIVMGENGEFSYSNFKFYIDGLNVPIGANQCSHNWGGWTYNPNSNYLFSIGKGGPLGQNYKGLLDDVMIYNRALSNSEVGQLVDFGQVALIWSTGSTTSSINVSPTSTTTYTCTATINGVSCTDSVTVVVNNPPFDLGNDVNVCGPSTTLTAPSGYDSYLWSNGATTNTTTVTANGTYTCTVTQGGCSASDTIEVALIDVTITASANTVCIGTSVNLAISSSLISNTEGTSYVEIPEGFSGVLQAPVGAFFTSVNFASYGVPSGGLGNYQYQWCHASNSIAIVSNLCLGNNSCVLSSNNDVFGDPCGGTYKYLFVLATYSNNNISYLWSTGETTATINVSPNQTTTYTCTVTTNGVSCSSNYTITVNNSSASTNIVTAFDSFTWLDGNTYTASNNTATYTTTNAAGCDSVISLNLTITPSSPTLALQVFLDGYYINSLNPAAMTAARYNNLVASGSANPGAASDVDVITVELRSPSNLDVVAYSVSPILQTNGSVQCVFPEGALGGSFYIVVKHRAAIPLWSANPMLISYGSAYSVVNNQASSYTDGDPVYPSMHHLIPGPLYGMWMGELNYDSYLDGNDYPLFEVDVNSSSYVGLYLLNGDLNGDTYVDASDYSVFDYNTTIGSYEQRPYATTNNVSIGQSYQGGIVAYVFQPSDFGYDPLLPHGIIVANQDLPVKYTWGPWNPTQYSQSFQNISNDIGRGKLNTDAILTLGVNLNLNFPAAQMAKNYTNGVYNDWFLPSLNDLIAIKNNLAINNLGNFDITSVTVGDLSTGYWSSSVMENYVGAMAPLFELNSTVVCGCAVFETYYVRPVRYF